MPNHPTILGWDAGGAHLKAALIDSEGHTLRVIQRACPLWRGLDQLEQALAAVLRELDCQPARHAVTMTGELADIFSDRRHGVLQLADCMAAALGRARTRFYAGPAGLVGPDAVENHALAIASANWHASAAFVASQVADGLLVDVGSTTADLILLQHGRPAALGYGDGERLRSGELVYTGVVRTPVMAVARQLPFAGEMHGLAAEHFATMADVYRLTGELAPAHDMAETADGQGRTPADSARRLARMIGRDSGEGSPAQWRALAQACRSRQLERLQGAAERILSRAPLAAEAPLIGAGAGGFLVPVLAQRLERPYLAVASLVRAAPEAAAWAEVCFPAHAVAQLARTEASC